MARPIQQNQQVKSKKEKDLLPCGEHDPDAESAKGATP
jgi:hypothetical protein